MQAKKQNKEAKEILILSMLFIFFGSKLLNSFINMFTIPFKSLEGCLIVTFGSLFFSVGVILLVNCIKKKSKKND